MDSYREVQYSAVQRLDCDHLKLLLHILCAIVIGLYFGDSGVNASKSISNIGFLLVNIVYIWYTTMMPGVLR